MEKGITASEMQEELFLKSILIQYLSVHSLVEAALLCSFNCVEVLLLLLLLIFLLFY